MNIRFFSPEFKRQRSQLLQDCLRQKASRYPIDVEYPIVLDPRHTTFSLCVFDEGSGLDNPYSPLVAHASIWPRALLDHSKGESYPLALVGNVATAPAFRGQGIMALLFAHMWQHVLDLGLEAIILWSDLDAFYHKLGFSRVGWEWRLFFARQKLEEFLPQKLRFYHLSPYEIDESLLQQLLNLRFKTLASLHRSLEEFHLLLTIPDTILLVHDNGQEVDSYCVIGKGCDLVGIVHEWGAKQPELLLAGLLYILETTAWQELCMLAPLHLPSPWRESFQPYLARQEKHRMAWIKEKSPHGRVLHSLEQGFIWGLDAI